MPNDHLAAAVRRVVSSDNCSGCGGCALIDKRISMSLSAEGFDRPIVTPGEGGSSRDAARRFRRVCPGARLDAPPTSAHEHATFGRYWSAWQGAAADEEIRRAGSSGGVLTALSTWLVETGRSSAVASAASGENDPRRTVPVRITSRAEALRAAGSRYAPVPTLDGWDPDSDQAVVAKPCEVAAARAIALERGHSAPILLSFFCAGTPSQRATNHLIETLLPDSRGSEIVALQYRGDGWPGRFRVRTSAGNEGTCSYEESWGNHLGTDLQWRCKLCVDGTGMSADIAVGDFWEADERGFPLFAEGEGNAVVLARTERGHDLLTAAARDGVIVLRSVDLDDVARIQPLQTNRRAVLGGRILGRLLAFRRTPRYYGYGVISRAIKAPMATAKAAVGTLTRTIGMR